MSDFGMPPAIALRSETGGRFEVRYPGPAALFLAWTAVGVLTSLRYQFFRPPRVDLGELAFSLACIAFYYPWVGLGPLVFRLEKRFPLSAHQWARNLGVLAGASLPISLVASLLMSGIFLAVLWVFGKGWGRPPAGFWFMHFPTAEVCFWASVAAGYFVRTQQELRERERAAARLALERSQLEASLKQAQLEAIRARLNPHFLFNCLQNISVLTREDPETASRMLARLGELLRTILRRDSEPEWLLREEIELARAYVALEQMRFGEQLQVSFSVAGEVESATVPSFLLQPLIENAIIHGLRGARRKGTITVTAAREGSELVLAVTDNGMGVAAEQVSSPNGGLGLSSTRERLAILYPERHSLEIRAAPQGGTEVRIRIPLKFADSEESQACDEAPARADRG